MSAKSETKIFYVPLKDLKNFLQHLESKGHDIDLIENATLEAEWMVYCKITTDKQLAAIKQRAEAISKTAHPNGFYIPGPKALPFYNFLTDRKTSSDLPLYELQLLWAEFLVNEESANA